MNAVISALLPLLSKLVPLATGTGTVGTIVNTLVEVVPILVKEYQDVLPIVKNIIATLKGDGTITPEQWQALDTLDKQVDDMFDVTAVAAEAEDKGFASPA